jgi:putative addiction module component (TIGR02574 family)
MPRPDADEILSHAMSLPADERLELATKLLDSVEGPEDPEWSGAWMAELDRRMEIVERGDAKLEDWETVKSSLLKELRKQ